MISSKFNLIKNDCRARAHRKGLRTTPYDIEEVSSLTGDELRTIWSSVKSIDSGTWDEKEYSYFVSSPVVKLMIDSAKIVSIKSYLEAKEMGILDKYLAYHEQGVNKSRYDFSDDYINYLEDCCLMSYEHAQRVGKLPEYFSGIGIFPICHTDLDRRYCGDYDDYIYSLTDIEYFQLLGKYRNKIPAKIQTYDSPVTFVDTALDQVEKYIEILRNLQDPIYIPGDGVGIGSFVCRLLKKSYFSSEPNKIGKEARLLGLITSSSPCRLIDSYGCNTIFLANVVNYIDKDILQFFFDSGKKICIWDEQPYLRGLWYNGGDVRLWMNYEVTDVLPEMKLRFPKILIGLAEKYNLVGSDNLSLAMMRKLKIKKNKDKSTIVVVTYPKLGYPSYNFLTRSFSYDVKNARTGQVKDYGSDLIEWYDDQIVLLDGYCGVPFVNKYEDVVLKNPFFDGEVIKVRERKPGRKRYVVMGTARYKITYMGYDVLTKESSYILNSDFCYRKKMKLDDEA